MKLTVLGATGAVGHQVVTQALAAGHDVTAVVRDPARLTVPEAAGLHVVTVPDATDRAGLLPALAGRDAVVSALGPADNRQAKADPIATRALTAATAAMEEAGVRRLVATSAAVVGATAPGEAFVSRAVVLPLVRRFFLNHVVADLTAMEAAIAASGTDWTVLRPPMLTDGPRTGTYRRTIGTNTRGGRTLSRADLADALLACLTDPSTIGQPVGVAV